jgi:hypothetical protein
MFLFSPTNLSTLARVEAYVCCSYFNVDIQFGEIEVWKKAASSVTLLILFE